MVHLRTPIQVIPGGETRGLQDLVWFSPPRYRWRQIIIMIIVHSYKHFSGPKALSKRFTDKYLMIRKITIKLCLLLCFFSFFLIVLDSLQDIGVTIMLHVVRGQYSILDLWTIVRAWPAAGYSASFSHDWSIQCGHVLYEFSQRSRRTGQYTIVPGGCFTKTKIDFKLDLTMAGRSCH